MEKTLMVQGMSCQGCVRHVTNALKEIEGVEAVAVDLTTGETRVTLASDVQESMLKEAVIASGYRV